MRVWRSVIAALVTITASIAVIVIGPAPASAAPNFKAPFPCGQSWTYSHHSAEVRLALDFVRNGGGTAGTPNLASAAGTAYRYYQAGGAGNYVVIDHDNTGWKTYYFHLASFSISHGQRVSQGQQIGTTGSTGNSSGAHIHYEQLYNGVGQTIHINGVSLAPYPGSYGIKSITSDNGCSSGGGTWFWTWGSGVRVRTGPYLSSAVVGTIGGPTQVKVLCQQQGDTVTAEGYTNSWWSKIESPHGFMTNIYIDHPSAILPGVPNC